jgi:ankyrin repeat protein
VGGEGEEKQLPSPSAAPDETSEQGKKPDEITPDAGVSEPAQESAPMAISPNEGESEVPPVENNDKDDSAVMTNGKMDTTPEQKAPKAKKKKPKYYCPHNLNERDNDENTPLHVAIHARKLEHVKLLVEAGASVHKKSDGSPPVHVAVSLGSLAKHAQFAYDCVVVLDENGADCTAKDDTLQTPLYLACMYNVPQIASYILSTETGLATLNARADRSQGRALHAAAKFDTIASAKAVRPSASISGPHARIPQLHHHPDGTVANALHHIPGYPGKTGAGSVKLPSAAPASTQSLLTQVLLGTSGIEIDALNSVGQTPLHVACCRGNWAVVRLLLKAGASPDIADRRGFTPGQVAHKRGMPIPNDLLEILGGPPSSGTVAPPRDLIVDPDTNTLLLTHELCGLHKTCPLIRRDSSNEPPPENVRRLQVLVDQETGILRTGEFNRCTWENETRRAAMVDILKVRVQASFCGASASNAF